MPPTYIPQMFNLEVNDLRVIRQAAEQKGLGDKDFSAALRSIIREWALQNSAGKVNSDSNTTSRQ